MSRVLAVLALLVLGASARQEETKNRPVTKVINLLKDMQKQLEKEAEEDEDVYDKLMCWCETNDKDKTQAIAEGEQRITDLGASVGELSASSARLTAEIETLEGEFAKNTNALEKATAIRRKDLQDFNDEERDSIQSITGLKNALTTLSKHNSAAFLQAADSDTSIQEIGVMLRSLLRTHKALLGEVVTPKQKRLINDFVDAPQKVITSLAQQPASAGSYAPQSGAIFGILKNMKESFEANLASSQQDESSASSSYQALKAAKNDELSSAQEQINTKTAERAAADEKCAQDKEERADAIATLDADRNFLAMLKSHCANVDAQMEQRQKTRSLEIAAVSKALAILSSDNAHDLFTKTFNPALVQTSMTTRQARRDQAASLLMKAAKKVHDPKLALLATRVKLDAFQGVVDSVQKMIDDLVVQKEDEIKLKDFCINGLNDNDHETQLKDKDKEFWVARVNTLESTISTLEGDIDGLNAEVAEMQLQMKKAGEDRAAENKEFQQVVADQTATQQILTSALAALKDFYAAALVQKGKQPWAGGEAPPPGFKTYENNSGSQGVMGMIQGIINDAKALEMEAKRSEESAQKAYEDYVADTNAAMDAANTEITNLTESKGKAEGDKAEADVTLDGIMGDLQHLSNVNADLHSECDFTLKNFDVRQAQRDQEMESLKSSIQILHGAAQGR